MKAAYAESLHQCGLPFECSKLADSENDSLVQLNLSSRLHPHHSPYYLGLRPLSNESVYVNESVHVIVPCCLKRLTA